MAPTSAHLKVVFPPKYLWIVAKEPILGTYSSLDSEEVHKHCQTRENFPPIFDSDSDMSVNSRI
jgi:hypothetical protein